MQSIKARIGKLFFNAFSAPMYLTRVSSDPTTFSDVRLADLSNNRHCYMLFEDKVYYFDSRANLTSMPFPPSPEFITLFPADVDQLVLVNQDVVGADEVGFFFISFLSSSLKNEYPDLYLYEQYSKQIQDIIWFFGLGVNLSAVFFYTANLSVTTIPYRVIKALEISLLEFVTANRYASQLAKIAVMKAMLESITILIVELSDDDIEDAFNAMTEQWMDDASWTMRAKQIILGLVLMPLTFTRFLFEAENYLVEATLLLGKIASIGFINLPIYIQSYFNLGSRAAPTPPLGLVPHIGLFAHSDVFLTEDATLPPLLVL